METAHICKASYIGSSAILMKNMRYLATGSRDWYASSIPEEEMEGYHDVMVIASFLGDQNGEHCVVSELGPGLSKLVIGGQSHRIRYKLEPAQDDGGLSNEANLSARSGGLRRLLLPTCSTASSLPWHPIQSGSVIPALSGPAKVGST
jgi:hypothetical protein